VWSYNYSNELWHFGIPGMHWGKHQSSAQPSDKSIARQHFKELKRQEKIQAKEFRDHNREVYKKTHGYRDVAISKTARNGWITQYTNKKGEKFTAKEVDDAWTQHEIDKSNVRRAITLTATSAVAAITIANSMKSPEFRDSVKSGKDFIKSVDWKTVRYNAAEMAFEAATKR
jgi:hypothetical protein